MNLSMHHLDYVVFCSLSQCDSNCERLKNAERLYSQWNNTTIDQWQALQKTHSVSPTDPQWDSWCGFWFLVLCAKVRLVLRANTFHRQNWQNILILVCASRVGGDKELVYASLFGSENSGSFKKSFSIWRAQETTARLWPVTHSCIMFICGHTEKRT